jgi:hypothetical protein
LDGALPLLLTLPLPVTLPFLTVSVVPFLWARGLLQVVSFLGTRVLEVRTGPILEVVPLKVRPLPAVLLRDMVVGETPALSPDGFG